jgi:hypothetical protein
VIGAVTAVFAWNSAEIGTAGGSDQRESKEHDTISDI